jgi:uncharacterized protein
MAGREGHFPGRAPIEAYGRGGFRFAGMSHRGSILSLPSGIWAWAPATPDDLDIAAFERVVAEAAQIDILLVGTGGTMALLAPDLVSALRERGLRPEPLSTGAAVRTHNILLSEGRRVAAALLAVE